MPLQPAYEHAPWFWPQLPDTSLAAPHNEHNSVSRYLVPPHLGWLSGVMLDYLDLASQHAATTTVELLTTYAVPWNCKSCTPQAKPTGCALCGSASYLESLQVGQQVLGSKVSLAHSQVHVSSLVSTVLNLAALELRHSLPRVKSFQGWAAARLSIWMQRVPQGHEESLRGAQGFSHA